jgi:hypothetical protein
MEWRQVAQPTSFNSGDARMRTVEMLEQSLAIAHELNYRVRHEWLGGSGGGACEFGGRKWLFVDLALSVDEQLEQICRALRTDPGIHLIQVHPAMRGMLDLRRAA